MGTQALEGPGQSGARQFGQVGAEMAGLKAADREFPAEDGLEQAEVVPMKEIEAPVAPVAFMHGPCDLVQRAQARAGILDGGQEVEVPPVGRPISSRREGKL